MCWNTRFTCTDGTLQPFVQLPCQSVVALQHLRLSGGRGGATSRAQGRQLISKQAAGEEGARRSGEGCIPLLLAVSQEVQQQMLRYCVTAICSFCACWQTLVAAKSLVFTNVAVSITNSVPVTVAGVALVLLLLL